MTVLLSAQRAVQTAEDARLISLQKQEEAFQAEQRALAQQRETAALDRARAEEATRRLAASELARNTLQYGGGGRVTIESLEDLGRRGLRLTFADSGPGIKDIELAMKDGYTTAGGLGLGLSGARRLSNDFHIHSTPGEGTRVTITRWR